MNLTDILEGHTSYNRWPDYMHSFIGERWRQGYSAQCIADELKLTRNQVIGIVWRNGFTRLRQAPDHKKPRKRGKI